MEDNTDSMFTEFSSVLKEMKIGNVVKPNYYNLPESEVIELMERLAKDSVEVLTPVQQVSLAHMLSYVLRFPYKGGLDDLKKAKYYLDRILKWK